MTLHQSALISRRATSYRFPAWLASDAFEAMTHESIGDAEAKFISPERGTGVELIEVKSSRLTPAKFWAEVDRFRAIDAGSPDTYMRFVLAASEASDEITTLSDGLKRVRGPHGFYANTGSINRNSADDFIRVVRRAGHSRKVAEFLLAKVTIELRLALMRDYSYAVFETNLAASFPDTSDLPRSKTRALFDALVVLLKQRRNQCVATETA